MSCAMNIARTNRPAAGPRRSSPRPLLMLLPHYGAQRPRTLPTQHDSEPSSKNTSLLLQGTGEIPIIWCHRCSLVMDRLYSQ
ncbi:hypothetical protein GDO81_019386 [Engystomops pustulosus]|uniref:Uncharacterized protein n=1 Tax=Engystomops pustulosus TaxID=76066 RepID=A0AAV6YE94_ENGPU|nr:hypothetical protein GDO81_019386 [Engystomops pustulosus]